MQFAEHELKALCLQAEKRLSQRCDGGVMVSIVAFQAVDPGSIPGHRTF